MNRLDKIRCCLLISYIQLVPVMYREIIDKEIYTSNNHILLHLKTHQHSYKDVKNAYHRFSVNNSCSSTKQQLEIRPESKTCWLFNIFLLVSQLYKSFACVISIIANLHVDSSIFYLHTVLKKSEESTRAYYSVNSNQSFVNHTNIERYVSITVKVILSFQGRE